MASLAVPVRPQTGTAYTPPAAAPKAAATKPLTLAQQAAKLANQSVAAQVAAIQQQQALETQQAQARAAQITAASQGAAQYVQGLGTPVYNTYKDAAQTLAGLSGGFSGTLRDTAQTQADKVSADLNAVGSPAQATNNAPALANVLYGMRGLQPASTLLNAGTAAASREAAVPSGLLGYGANLAAGALGAGQTAADSLTPQILDAQGKLPTLTTQYLNSLVNQAYTAHKSSVEDALAASTIGSRAASAKTAGAKLTIDQQNANTAAARASSAAQAAAVRNEIAQFNANTARYKALNPKAPATKVPSTSTLKAWNTAADNFYQGVAPKQRWDATTSKYVAVPGTGQPPVNWSAAVAGMLAMGATRKQAIQQLNAAGWKPGEGGRPQSKAQKQSAANVAKATKAMSTTPSWISGG